MPAGRGTPVAAGPPVRPAPRPAPASRSGGGFTGLAHAIGRAVGAAKAAGQTVAHASPAAIRAATVNTAHPAIRAPTQGQSRQARLQALQAARTRLAAQDPFASIASSGLLQTRPLAQMIAQAMLNQDFSSLQDEGLLPKGAKEPSLSFPSGAQARANAPGGYAYQSGVRGGAVSLPPQALYDLSNARSPLHATAEHALIHESAHSMQSPRTLSNVVLREGGADAYARAVEPKIAGPINPPENPTYGQYMQLVRRLGQGYFMRGQFG